MLSENLNKMVDEVAIWKILLNILDILVMGFIHPTWNIHAVENQEQK